MSLNPPAGANLHATFPCRSVRPSRVLLEAERPVVFLVESEFGQILLAYAADEQPGATWYVMAAVTQAGIEDLEAGRRSVRDVLTHSWMWLVRTDDADRVDGVWAVTESDIPDPHLPRPGTCLLLEQQPLLVSKAVGKSIVPGRIPSSVVSFVSTGASKAVKALLDFAISSPQRMGRPNEELRALYDLPVQQVAFSSFAISFARPTEQLVDRELVDWVGDRLDAAARWAAVGSTATEDPWSSDAELEAMLRAMVHLSPPRSGPIEAIELAGRWIRNGTVELDRTSRKKVRMHLRNSPPERVVQITARIGEVDRDGFTFILRDVDGGQSTPGSFAEELLDDVVQYFADDQRVSVAGTTTSAGRLHVTAIAAVST